MQIAYLILAHSSPTLVGRLIDALDSSGVHFFIHIDKKVELNEFKNYTARKPNVHYVENRIKVFWGGFSMVEATLNLMQEAIKSGNDFKYAILLSGSHYPIKSNDYIFEFLRNSDCEYLQFAETREIACDFKTKCYCLYDYMLFNPRTVFSKYKYLNKIAKIPGFAVNLISRKIIPMFYERKLGGNIIPYTGVNWWALTRPCFEYVLDYVENNKGYVEFFRFSVQPDETFFHTIICNPPFKLANSDITLRSLMRYKEEPGQYANLKGLSLTFTKCSRKGVPKTLCETDIPELNKEFNYFNYPQLFARKFDLNVSLETLNIIDKEILIKAE